MEGECTSSNSLEMSINDWDPLKVKQELTGESTNSWPNVFVKEEPILQFKEELKKEENYFDDAEDTELQASCNQIKIEHIELIENCPEAMDPTLKGVREPTDAKIVKNFGRKGNSIQDVLKAKPQSGLYSKQKPKSFMCFQCERVFSCNGNLKVHIMSVHNKLKIFKCDHCDFSCSQKGNLSNHIKVIHEKLREFKCNWPNCEYAGGEKAKLIRHIHTVHEKLKKFQCLNCGYVCCAKSNLVDHIRSSHEKLKKFKCSHCDYSCSLKHHLSRHIKMVHEN